MYCRKLERSESDLSNSVAVSPVVNIHINRSGKMEKSDRSTSVYVDEQDSVVGGGDSERRPAKKNNKKGQQNSKNYQVNTFTRRENEYGKVEIKKSGNIYDSIDSKLDDNKVPTPNSGMKNFFFYIFSSYFLYIFYIFSYFFIYRQFIERDEITWR